MDQKQKVLVSIILIIAFLSIVMTELKLWDMVYIIIIGVFTNILVPLELLVVFVCVRLYRAFHNPFFKFQGIALAFSVAVAGLGELRLILVNRLIRLINDFDKLQIISTSMGVISAIIGLAGILLALYALLQYREGWEQAEDVSLIKRFYDLIPSAGNNRFFWYIIVGSPLLITMPLFLSTFSGSVTHIIISVFNTAWLPAELLGLLLILALLRIYKNNLFKYLAAVYIISLSITALSFFSSYLGLFLYRLFDSNPPAIYVFSQITLSHILGFHKVVLAGLLVYALLNYKESEIEPAM